MRGRSRAWLLLGAGTPLLGQQPPAPPPRSPLASWPACASLCRMPAGRSTLELDVTWERKTATRLPEAVWLRWVPQQDAGQATARGGARRRACMHAGLPACARLAPPHALLSLPPCAPLNPLTVDPDSWRLFKLGQPISPLEVMRNGSQSMHAVGDEGVTVDSADGRSRLRIRWGRRRFCRWCGRAGQGSELGRGRERRLLRLLRVCATRARPPPPPAALQVAGRRACVARRPHALPSGGRQARHAQGRLTLPGQQHLG